MADSSSERDPVEKLADEFLARFRRGEKPALTEYTERYPEWAERIRKVFPALVLMEGARPETGEAPGADGGDVRTVAECRLERLGDYRILREVGRGGMGIVYEAEQISLGRHVALKVLPSHALLDPRHLGRFQREAKAAAWLHHTNIVPVYGVGEDQGLHYYVMQFIQGLGLDEVLAELRRLRRVKQAPRASDTGTGRATPSSPGREVSAEQVAQALLTGDFTPGHHSVRGERPAADPSPQPVDAPRTSVPSSAVHLPGQAEGSTLSETGRSYWHSVARVGIQVAEALAYAHGQGILHRDIKPSNLLLDTQGTVWVTDFGLAKAADSEDLTHPGDIVGTVRYLAPERFEGKADARSDVYALGLTLYELLTLRPAFDESDRNKLVAQVMRAEPSRPRQLVPEVPRDLETIVLKALARDPDRRYPSAQELAADLKRYVAGEPIRARRVRAWTRLVLWAKRRPALAALLVVSGVAALALVGLVVGLLYNARLGVALDEAHQAREAEAEQRQEAQRFRYFHSINLAEREWWANELGRTLQLLQECPTELRGWEWHYLDQLCHQDLLTLPVVDAWLLSPDGRWLAGAGEDKTVKIWDAATGQEIRTLGELAYAATHVAFRPDGKHLAVASSREPGRGPAEVKIWDTTTGREVLAFQEPEQAINGVAYSPDGHGLATAGGVYSGRPGEVTIRDATTGQVVRTWRGQAGPFQCVAFSPDGQRLAAASAPAGLGHYFRKAGEMKVWDLTTGQEVHNLHGHQAMIGYMAFSPDGRRLAAVDLGGAGLIWDATTGQVVLTLHGQCDAGAEVAFSPDGQLLASAGEGSAIQVWDAATGRNLRTLRGHTDWVHLVAFSPTGRRLVTASSDGTVKVWDPTVDQGAFTLGGHTESVGAVAFSPDGKHLASASHDGYAKVWDARSGQQVGALHGHNDAVVHVAFSPDGRRVATASLDGTAKVWEVATGLEVSTFRGHTEAVFAVTFHPDGRQLASGGIDKTVRIWEVTTGQEIQTLRGHSGSVLSTAFGPDGRWLASASGDQTVKLWEVATGQEIRTLRGHTSGVTEVAFSPDGTRLATNSGGKTVKIWDVTTGQEVLTLRGHGKYVQGVAFHPDGRRLASASMDATVKIWEAAPLTPELRLQREAAAVINRLIAEPFLKEEALERLQTDAALSEPLRQQALTLMERYREDPYRLREASLAGTFKPGAAATRYHRALRQAEVAHRLVSSQNYYYPSYVLALGRAQYRVGHYQEAVDTLTRTKSIFRDHYKAYGEKSPYAKSDDPTALAFLAMAHYQLGQQDQARAVLDRLRESMKLPTWANNPGPNHDFLREAEALLQGPSKPADS